MKKILFLFCIASLGLLLACSNNAAETLPAPTATVISDPPVTAVPTATLASIVDTPTAGEPTPTATPLPPTPTMEPAPATATATLSAENEQNGSISAPAADSILVAGERVTVVGQAEPGSTGFDLTIVIGQYPLLTTTASPDESGNWSVDVSLPPNVAGTAQIQASANGVFFAAQPVTVTFAVTDPVWLSVNRPASEDRAVAGYTFFFDGQAVAPIKETVTIGILTEQCTEFISRQSFMLPGGIWRGQLILPETAPPGPACAIAYTGDFPAGEWWGTITPIEIQAYEEQTPLLLLGNIEVEFRAGSSTNLFGIAANAANGEVAIQLISDGSPTKLIANGTAFVDSFGYWEIDLVVPADSPPGAAQLLIAIGTETDDTHEIVRDVIIAP